MTRLTAGAAWARHRLHATFTQLCLAIDYAHSRGVVHRDMKPDNVMLAVTVHAPANRRMERVWLGISMLIVPYLLEVSGLVAPTWIAGATSARVVSQVTTVPPPAWFFVVHGSFIALAVAQGLFPRFDAARRAELR